MCTHTRVGFDQGKMKLDGFRMGLCRGGAAILSHAGQVLKAWGSGSFRDTAGGCLHDVNLQEFIVETFSLGWFYAAFDKS